MTHLQIFTDGGFQTVPVKKGSWGFVVIHGEQVVMQDKGVLEYDGVTSQRAEMTAILNALTTIQNKTFPNHQSVNITLSSDSQYCVRSLNEWLLGWKARGWKTSSGTVKNIDLWKRIMPLAYNTFGQVEFKWVRGHDGNFYNELADQLCNEALGRKV